MQSKEGNLIAAKFVEGQAIRNIEELAEKYGIQSAVIVLSLIHISEPTRPY